MFHEIEDRMMRLNLIQWIIAYVAIIALYTQISESFDLARDLLSFVARAMLILIAAVLLVRVSEDF